MTNFIVVKEEETITISSSENKKIKPLIFNNDGSDLNNSKLTKFILSLSSIDDNDIQFINGNDSTDTDVLFIIDLFNGIKY